MSLRELELSQLAGSSAGEAVERQEDSPAAAAAAAADTADMSAPELSQLAGSSAGEGIEHQEDSPAAAAAAADTADRSQPELNQLAGSSADEGIERQEDSPAAAAADIADRSAPEISELAGSSAVEGVERQENSPAAVAAAAAAADIANRSAAELRRLNPTGVRGGDQQAVENEILEADVIFVPVENSLFARVFVVPNPLAVRYVYAVLFAWMTIVAWILRDIELSRFDHYACDGSHDCITADGVLRASMALAFFFIMFVSTVNTRKRYEVRNFWHCRFWDAKAAIFVIGCGFALYAPSFLIQFYGTVAHAGAWLFLVIQFFSMTSFIMWVNRWCRVQSNRDRWAQKTYGLLPLSAAPVVLYLGSFLGLGFMYYWYAWEPTTFIYISVAMSVICLMSLISCLRKVSGGYLAPGLMLAYVVLMCLTTIRSEPHMETSNSKTKHTADWQNILSFVIAAVVIITSTYTVGIDSKCIRFNYTPELGDDVPYGYGFFHLVFASGAMYIGMLFIGWNAHRSMDKWTVDFSWASTKVRVTSGLVVAICYVAMLASQDLWDLMLAVTSNSTPAANEAIPAGAPVVPPVA